MSRFHLSESLSSQASAIWGARAPIRVSIRLMRHGPMERASRDHCPIQSSAESALGPHYHPGIN
jgi:hypothetical protein